PAELEAGQRLLVCLPARLRLFPHAAAPDHHAPSEVCCDHVRDPLRDRGYRVVPLTALLLLLCRRRTIPTICSFRGLFGSHLWPVDQLSSVARPWVPIGPELPVPTACSLRGPVCWPGARRARL